MHGSFQDRTIEQQISHIARQLSKGGRCCMLGISKKESEFVEQRLMELGARFYTVKLEDCCGYLFK